MNGDFNIKIDTNFIFNDHVENIVGKELKQINVERVLLVHDGSPFLETSGILDKVRYSLMQEQIEFIELSGILPNPRLSTVYKGIELVKVNKLNFILTIGGGSVIDTGKAIGLGGVVDYDVWDFFEGRKTPKNTIPVGSIVTYPSSGSESSSVTMINNTQSQQKLLVSHDIVRPQIAFMNPKLAFSLPPSLTAMGIVDMFSHICERYFAKETTIGVIDRMAEGALKTIVRLGPDSITEPDNYFARSELMWISTIAQNNTLGIGRTQDWATHLIGNELSAVFDTPHGVTISIIMPAWMKYVSKKRTDRLERFAVKVFDVNPVNKTSFEIVNEGIEAVENFFKILNMPITFQEFEIPVNKMEQLLSGIEFDSKDETIGNYVKLTWDDCKDIYQLASQI